MNVFLENGITCLDLHGERHHDVPDISIDFVYRHQAQLPLLIICGNSQRMISLVEDELKSNIFLRCDQNDLKVKLNMKNQEDFEVFKKVRDLKDSF